MERKRNEESLILNAIRCLAVSAKVSKEFVKMVDFSKDTVYTNYIESCFGFARAKYSRKDGAATLYFFILFYYSLRNVRLNVWAYSIFYYKAGISLSIDFPCDFFA